jgi:hypothetical protein
VFSFNEIINGIIWREGQIVNQPEIRTSFLGMTDIGDARKVGKGGSGKGPAILPKLISLSIFLLAISYLSSKMSLECISKGRHGPE